MGGVNFGLGFMVCDFVVCCGFVLLVVGERCSVGGGFGGGFWWSVLVVKFWGLIFGVVCGSIILVKKGGTVLRCDFRWLVLMGNFALSF